MIECLATVVFVELEGGFWALCGDDGNKYRPERLPSGFQKRDMRVRVRMKPTHSVSLHMWGTEVTLRHIEAVTD